MRWEIANKFAKLVIPNLDLNSRVAILGGSSSDAEVQIIKQHNPLIEFFVIGIENENLDQNFVFLDLNTLGDERILPSFDLVLCSQVLEHVWNHANFFENLAKLCKVNGSLWLACPKSNMEHGSPEYFSAGFTSEYLARNLQEKKFEVIEHGDLGSRRYYISTHLNQEWLGENEHKRPVRGFDWKNGTPLGKINRFRKLLIGRILLTFYKSKLLEGSQFSTESWVLAVKNS